MKIFYLVLFFFISINTFGQSPIQDHSQTQTLMIGPAKLKRFQKIPRLLKTFDDFKKYYDSKEEIEVNGKIYPNLVALSAEAFFKNNGNELIVVSVKDNLLQEYKRIISSFATINELKVILTPSSSLLSENDQIELIHFKSLFKSKLFPISVDQNKSVSQLITLFNSFDSENLVALTPWVLFTSEENNKQFYIPPGAFLAGSFVYNDANRSISKPPANLVLNGINGVFEEYNRSDIEALNSANIIPLINIKSDSSYRFYGGRVLSRSSEFKYLSHFRTNRYLIDSIQSVSLWTTNWVNNEILWTQAKFTISNFLHESFRKGLFQGMSPKDAYFVKCDYDTMTTTDILEGRLVCLVGYSFFKPAEFSILRFEFPTKLN